MTTFRFDAFDAFILACALLMIVEGLLRASGRLGLIERVLPGRLGDRSRRWARAGICFLLAGAFFYAAWRGG
jgi:hypothetical protein